MNIKVFWQYIKFLLRGTPAPADGNFDFIRPGMLVFDVGANRGNYTKLFLAKGARVISIEPQKDCIQFLKLRFAFTNKVKILPVGAGAKSGEQTFFLSNADSISSMNQNWIDKVKATKRFSEWNVEWKKSVTVQLTTLDILIEKYGLPAYVKIDVEGFEMDVLKGLTKPVANVSFEYTLPEMKNEAIACVDYLVSIGSYVFRSQLSGDDRYVSRDSIVAEINTMCENGTLYNGDIFAAILN